MRWFGWNLNVIQYFPLVPFIYLKLWKRLFAGTPPDFKNLFARTPPVFKNFFAGTTPSFKNLFAGTPLVFKNLFAGTPPAFKNLFAGTLLAKTTHLQESFGKEQLICRALVDKHCGLDSINIFNDNLLKLVHCFSRKGFLPLLLWPQKSQMGLDPPFPLNFVRKKAHFLFWNFTSFSSSQPWIFYFFSVFGPHNALFSSKVFLL